MLVCICVCEVCVLLCDIRREEKRKRRREGTKERRRDEGRELCHIVTKVPILMKTYMMYFTIKHHNSSLFNI